MRKRRSRQNLRTVCGMRLRLHDRKGACYIKMLKLPLRGGFLYAGGRCKLPIYEYRCSNGHQYERSEGFDAPVEQSCPTCGSPSRRQISLPAVVFKGRGFYSTDNRKGSVSDNGSSTSLGSDHSQSDENGSKPKAEAAKAD